MSDVYDPMIDRLEQIAGNVIDVETEQGKTNELLAQVLEELKTLNKALKPVPFPPTAYYPPVQQSGYACMWCGGWISTPAPHNCPKAGQFT